MEMFRNARFRLLATFFSIFFVSFIWGCTAASRTKMMVDNMKPMMEKMKIAANKNSDIELLKDAMPASLVQLDGFVEISPDNRDLLLRAAEANAGYAFAFVKDRNRKRMFNEKARDYALRVLKQNDNFHEAFDKSLDEYIASLDSLEKEDVPALFFASSSWLQWIALSLTDPEALMDLPKVEAMMERVLELDDTFMYGSIHAGFGSYYAARSVTLGGKPVKAKYHFDKAFEISESKYLVFSLLYARYYAVQIQDKELFVETLNKVISAPPNLLPEKNLANEIARIKAKELLAEVDEYF